MKSSHIISLCLLTTALYLFSRNISSSSSSSSNFLPGRRPMRELIMSPSNRKAEQQIKVDGEIKRSIHEGSMVVEYAGSDENVEELGYHIDYHGVMTHPTPTPKHPKQP